jgi:hypothetical protein
MTSLFSRRILVTLLAVAALHASAACVWAAPCSLTAADINAYLQGKNSPLAAFSATLVQRGLEWNVDPRLIVAIAGAESSFGTRLCAANNAWNWFWNGTCSRSPFDSWESGILSVTKGIRLSYLNKGRTTIELIGAKYCASGCQNWVPNVTTFYATELKGDVRDLGCAPECKSATCSTFVPCATPGAGCTDPVCVKIAGVPAGQCVEGTTPCAGLADCTSSADCGTGVCAVDTCCGKPVCAPVSVFCTSNSGAKQLARPKALCGQPTIGSCKSF